MLGQPEHSRGRVRCGLLFLCMGVHTGSLWSWEPGALSGCPCTWGSFTALSEEKGKTDLEVEKGERRCPCRPGSWAVYRGIRPVPGFILNKILISFNSTVIIWTSCLFKFYHVKFSLINTEYTFPSYVKS